jgi:hypothetical protein
LAISSRIHSSRNLKRAECLQRDQSGGADTGKDSNNG